MYIYEGMTKQVGSICSLVESRYNIDLTQYHNNPDHVYSIFEHYSDRVNLLRIKDIDSSEYTKAFLIYEAARMLLREIAPRRIKKRKKK